MSPDPLALATLVPNGALVSPDPLALALVPDGALASPDPLRARARSQWSTLASHDPLVLVGATLFALALVPNGARS